MILTAFQNNLLRITKILILLLFHTPSDSFLHKQHSFVQPIDNFLTISLTLPILPPYIDHKLKSRCLFPLLDAHSELNFSQLLLEILSFPDNFIVLLYQLGASHVGVDAKRSKLVLKKLIFISDFGVQLLVE